MRPLAFIIVVYNEPYDKTVTYKNLKASLNAIKEIDYRIYIYDNSDKLDYHSEYENLNLYVYKNPKNPGISVAYNYMADKAMQDGCEWIVLLDQDTEPPSDFASKYHYASLNNNNIKLKVPVLYSDGKLMSPLKYIFKRAVNLKQISPGVYSLKDIVFVNSGLMVNLGIFKKVGGYNENIKLDFADFQFIERIKKEASHFEVIDVKCIQNFSHVNDDLNKAIKRYRLYLADIKHCVRNNYMDELGYMVANLLHTLKLSWKYKTIEFLKLKIISDIMPVKKK